MSLRSELEELFNDMAATLPAGSMAAIGNAARDLATSGITERALKQGDMVPAFELPDQDGNVVSLAEVLRAAPVVLSFNRGSWCPFCNLELRAYQKALPEIERAGGRLIAVMPQAREISRKLADAAGLRFPLLSDAGCQVADRFGISFELPPSLRDIYADAGFALPAFNATHDWQLPIPATFIIEQSGRIALADVEPDVQFRLEPLDAIAAIRALGAPRLPPDVARGVQ